MNLQPEFTSPGSYGLKVSSVSVRVGTVGVAAILAFLLFLPYPAPAAEAQETPGVEVGDGTVRIGDDVFAGDGCARAGDVVAGDCGEGSKNQPGDGQEKSEPDKTEPSGDDSGGTTVQKETAAPETTGAGTTVQNTTGAGRTEGGTTQPGSTQPGSTQPGSTSEDIEACPTAPPEDAAPATVERAVDGDTVELQEPLDGYDTVRLIGVNTPEMEGQDGSPEPGAQEASRFTADALEDKEVVLETGEETEDDYGRLLAYVWLVPETGDPELFNRTLVAEGYAEPMTIEPNDAYAECFKTEAGENNPGSEETRQGEKEDKPGLLGRLKDLLSSETPGKRASTDGPAVTEDQYLQAGSTDEPGSTELAKTEAIESPEGLTVEEESVPTSPGSTGGTTGGGAELPIANPEAEELVSVPPESCPGATVVLEPFGTNGGAQSEPFEVTGRTFVVRADLKSEKPADTRLEVQVLDTETQEPVEEFSQRSPGSYYTSISQGPGSYLLNLQPEAGSYEVAVFDCADEESKQGAGEDAPGAPLELGSSTPSETPPAQQSGAGPDQPTEQPTEQPAELELAAGDEPVPTDDSAEPSEVDLPTQDGPTGDEVAVLPDTGGPVPGPGLLLTIVVGTLTIVAGVAGLAASVGFDRGTGRRSSTDSR